MKIVVAPDSYKGSLSQVQAATIMKNAVYHVLPNCHVVEKPMADGGEGTLEVLLQSLDETERLPIAVTGPIGKKINTSIGVINGDTGVIEIASIAGLPMVPEILRNPYFTTTYGIGEAIRSALDHGLRKFIIGLGGSATNDGGLGMLLALGATILDQDQKRSSIYGQSIKSLSTVDLQTLDRRIDTCTFQIASDVDNPLFGPNGASAMFGPQKGANKEQVCKLDQALQYFHSKIVAMDAAFESVAYAPGAGAAGGLGYALMILGGTLLSGAELIGKQICLESAIKNADVILTGEGKSDVQTLRGKVPGYVAKLAKKHHKPVILISGSVEDEQILQERFTKTYSMMPIDLTVNQAMKQADMLLWKKTEEIIIKIVGGDRSC